VGAAEIAEQAVGRLSGGQQQRVMIAAAIVSNPSLLLLDEPLANLDPANTADIIGLLDSLRRSRPLGIVLSAHDVNPLLGALDRVVYLAHGHAAVGRAEEVIRTDVLSHLYDHPIEVARFEGHLIVLAGDAAAHHHEDEKQDGGRPW
jgi:zinc/manganese transport system ATP-binding protein